MGKRIRTLTSSAPGRICLFGEHREYLGLPVIPCAISLRISVKGKKRNDIKIDIDLPDVGERKAFPLQDEIPYVEERDYFRSAINVLQRDGFTFSTGFDCVVHGEIPISAGTSSSSALVVAWVNFLTQMSDQAVTLDAAKIADYAYRAEVLEFSEPGGMMDQYSAALGGIFFLDSVPKIKIDPLQANLKAFVLGDSNEPKDTKFILARVKRQVHEATERVTRQHPDFSLRTTTLEELREFSPELTEKQFETLRGTMRNYQITREAKKLLQQKPLDHHRIGTLLNEHQVILREILQISTPKIDRMIAMAIEAGAYGAKINGSGGGGCMFAYAPEPENAEEIAEAIEKVGGRAYIVHTARGTYSAFG
ncbi:MAG: mevalonate kinase family protein [Candidatus Hodarchaeales archaeon]